MLANLEWAEKSGVMRISFSQFLSAKKEGEHARCSTAPTYWKLVVISRARNTELEGEERKRTPAIDLNQFRGRKEAK